MILNQKFKTQVVFTIVIFFLTSVYSQPNGTVVKKQNIYPSEVETVLRQSGKNRQELERAINYFQQSGDSLKLKAIYFLIANMDIHYSADYYWADSLNHHLPFNELSYPTFDASLKAFDELKKRTSGIHPVPVAYWDKDSIKANFLIENVEKAFEAWKLPWAKHVPFNLFCEYVLPYRISEEPFQEWRKEYSNKYDSILAKDKAHDIVSASNTIKNDIRNWFTNTYYIETRKEPIPRLGPQQLLFRKQGPCEDIAGLAVYAMRSQGLASTEDMAIYWGTSSGSHFWNVVCNQDLKPTPIDITSHDTSAYKLAREPAKVIRLTYSKQSEALASQVPANEIPYNLLKLKNILDVTEQYWPVKDITCPLYPPELHLKVAYACVFNYSAWKPSWWGFIKNGKVKFDKMSQGVIYLPMYYTGNKLLAAGNPVAIPYKNEPFEIIPDTINRHTITILEQENYLIFRPGKYYHLFYWDKQWKSLANKAVGYDHQLIFDMVPRNALLLLVSEYSQHKERPFMINDKGERTWW
jgi:Transglutaminase-like superfamily.